MALFRFTPLRGVALGLGLALLPGLVAAQTCPNVDLTGQAINQGAAALATAQTFPVVAGGGVDLGGCMDVPGNGFVAESPDFELSYSGATGQDLQLSVTASCDAVLLVNDSAGEWWHSDDADGGTNPRLVLSGAQDGVFDIWVGTYDAPTCDASLVIQTFPAGTAPPLDQVIEDPVGTGLCPDFNLPAGQDIAADLSQLAAPQTYSVVAGGDIDLLTCPETLGVGYVIQSPDFELALSGNAQGADVTVSVLSQCDPVLLINDASGAWLFNDDFNGDLNPSIVLSGAMDGVYDIWVGSLGTESCDATLQIAGPASAAPGGKGGGQTPPPPPDEPTVDALADPGNLTAYRADVGAVLSFTVTGSTDGIVWGTGIYTDDSDLSTAAVHAGILAAGETGVVTVTMTGPQSGFTPSEANGVASSSFGSWGGSYTFIPG